MWTSVLSFLAPPNASALPTTYREGRAYRCRVAHADLEAASAEQAPELEPAEHYHQHQPPARRRTAPGSSLHDGPPPQQPMGSASADGVGPGRGDPRPAPSPLPQQGPNGPAQAAVVLAVAYTLSGDDLEADVLPSAPTPPALPAVADGDVLPVLLAAQRVGPHLPGPLPGGPPALALDVDVLSQADGPFDGTAELRRGAPCKGPLAAMPHNNNQRVPPNGLLGGLYAPGLFRHESFPPGADAKAGPRAARERSMTVPCLPAGPPVARFDDLRFVQQIGQGGFGKVFSGYLGEQRVAIKLAHPQGGQDMEQLVCEFQREVVAMSAVPPHPNVLRLVAACTEPPRLALVTDYCPLGSLYGVLHSPRPPGSQAWLLNVCLGVASGMAHLHHHRVLHRDLKSSNILLDTSGANPARIADFGLARVYRGKQALTGGLGTYQWMAPEVLAHQRYSEKADIYSFAVIMWECCTRALPYQDMTPMQAAVGVVNHGLRPDIPRSCPPDVAALIKECWAAVPDQRPSFEQIVLRLGAILEASRSCQGAPGG